MKPIAIIGAGGYVGARLLEQAELLGQPTLVPIVRSWRSQGRVARYGVRTKRGSASDSASLVPLIKGCAMVVNLTMGDNGRMVGDVQAIHDACHKAGVPLFVHISSGEVFGRAASPDLREDSFPDGSHWMEYGRAKAAAEAWLRSRSDGPVKTVILRPGLIWGPGSGWLVGPAQALLDGTASVFREGGGICNLIHVDNLIRHLLVLAAADRLESGVFNVSDAETHTWLDYYTAIAREVGVDPSTIHRLPDSAYREGLLQKVAVLGQMAPAKAIKRRMAGATKIRIKQQLQDWLRPPLRSPETMVPSPAVTKDLWWIQGTVNKLPTGGFQKRYPGLRLRTFPDLMASAGRWLRFAGFDAAS